MNTTPREHGLSLVELLVGLALAAMLMAPLAALLRSGASAGAAINEQTELQVQAQFAMQRMLARVQNTPYAPLPTKLDDTTSGSWLSPALYDLRAGTNGLAVVETIAGASHVLAEPASSLSITSQPANTGQTLVVIALTLTRNNATVSLRESARLGALNELQMGRTRQTGAVLLAVTIMMAIIGALAYSLSRQTGMASQSVEAQYDATSARYLAEAGLNMARWVHQNQGCKPKPVSPVAGTLAGAGAYNVVVSKAASKNIDIVATATTATGAVAVLARAGVLVYPLQDTPETKTLSVKIIDTYVNTPFTAGVTNNGGITLPLSQGTSQALLQFPLTDIPAGALVSSATLTLVQNGSSGVPRPVSMHRVTTQWDAASATWTAARAGVAWTTPGGDFSPAAAAQVNVSTAASNSWDVTTLLDAWASGRQPNYGVLVRMASALQSANFYSYEASTAWRPTVTVKFYAPC